MTAFAIVTALLLAVLGGAQSFWTWTDDIGVTYQALAVVALVLLVVPLASLGGAAARLSARRRDDRLATLRLLGATPATVSALAVLESVALAVAGSLAGVALYFVLVPLLALIPFRGEALGLDGVLLSMPALAAVFGGVVLLAAVSAVLGLRRVVISPLGVRTKQDAPKLHWLRIVIGAAVIAIAFLMMAALQVAGSVLVIIAMLGVAFGGTIAVLNLIGPWVIRLVAASQARRAKTPARLLAARAVLEAPKAAWRQVSGVAMTSFMAVFAGTGIALLGSFGETGDLESQQLFADIRTGILITVVGSFLMVACSVGVNQAAGILDRGELYRSLDMLGMPTSTMDAAAPRGHVAVAHHGDRLGGDGRRRDAAAHGRRDHRRAALARGHRGGARRRHRRRVARPARDEADAPGGRRQARDPPPRAPVTRMRRSSVAPAHTVRVREMLVLAP
ncbi:FtsX-like permease family protein [Agromyces laixinhei]|uniref:FtsX-like permease family protein n=1 Tax=Agromyces laixinhei TaxID=2585717 RepID=UPI001F2F3806|nr:FtsX-like permease family protein [Agromyces laixinhei]